MHTHIKHSWKHDEIEVLPWWGTNGLACLKISFNFSINQEFPHLIGIGNCKVYSNPEGERSRARCGPGDSWGYATRPASDQLLLGSQREKACLLLVWGFKIEILALSQAGGNPEYIFEPQLPTEIP